MIDHGEIGSRLAVTVHAYPVVDGGEVIQHFVGRVDLVLEISQDSANKAGGAPARRNGIFSPLRLDGRAKTFAEGIDRIGDRGSCHTCSCVRKFVTC